MIERGATDDKLRLRAAGCTTPEAAAAIMLGSEKADPPIRHRRRTPPGSDFLYKPPNGSHP